MAKRKPFSIQEALSALGQEQEPPKPPPQKPPVQTPPAPWEQEATVESAIHKEIPYGIEEIGKFLGRIAGEKQEGIRGPSGTPEDTVRDVTQLFNQIKRKPQEGAPQKALTPEQQKLAELNAARGLKGVWSEPIGPTDRAERGVKGIWSEPVLPSSATQQPAVGQMTGVREPSAGGQRPQLPSAAEGEQLSPEELGAIIQKDTGLRQAVEHVQETPPSGPVKGTANLPEEAANFDMDRQLQRLAERATATKSPSILEAISVLAASLNPRMSPLAVQQLARQLGGEPERMQAQAGLERLTAMRGKAKEAEANMALKRELAGLHSGTQMGVAQMGQQGAMDRVRLEEQGRMARAGMKQGQQATPSYGQQIALMKAVTQPIGQMFRDIDVQRTELERQRSFMAPEAYQARRVQLEDAIKQANAARRDAILKQIQDGHLSEDVAGAFMTAEGIPLPGSEEALKVQELLQKNADIMKGQR